MKEPVSLDLFSPDLFPEPIDPVLLRIFRNDFLDQILEISKRRLRHLPCGFQLTRARRLLESLGGLGGVW